jgi:hypothetical protein
VRQRVRNPAAQKLPGVGVTLIAADVFHPPSERPHSAVIVRRPATMLVLADSLLEPRHDQTGI